jgi:hypothetical protein
VEGARTSPAKACCGLVKISLNLSLKVEDDV